MEKRENFLRENRLKEYRRLRKAGELEAHLELGDTVRVTRIARGLAEPCLALLL